MSNKREWLRPVVKEYPTPWTIKPLSTKYYGTEVVDARGNTVCAFWICAGEPSARELGDLTIEDWREDWCDTHWESEAAWQFACEIVAMANAGWQEAE